MANALYANGRAGFLRGEIDFDTAEITVALVQGYTADLADEVTVADMLTAGGVIAASAVLSPKTTDGGVADGGDIVFTAVAAGDPITAIVVYQSTDVSQGALDDDEKRLIAYYDTSSGATLPFTPNGGDITLQWDNGANKMFSL